MLRTSAFILAIAGQVALAATAAADTSRGCKAQWEVRYNGQTSSFGHFDSRGRCRSGAYANDCRRQARGYAQACFRDHWNRRWDDVIPPDCVGGRGGVGVMNYSLRDLKKQIELHACALHAPMPFRVHVVGRTWGDKRCGGEEIVSQTYEIVDAMCGKID
ncbi:MAG TPA: hypothetical protein VLE23_12550 [Geminicoccaceae bacterium]|nr:hypothetical protein [Geminicoccaceae bacterium]